MKILHIITGLNDGGAEAVLFSLCTREQENTHTVISLMDEGKYGFLLKSNGITVKTLGMKRGRVTLFGLYRLFKLIRLSKPDVVQTWMYHADLLGGAMCRLAGVNAVVWGIHHSELNPEQSRRSTILIAKLSSKLSRFIPKRIAVCAEMAAKLHADLGYALDKMVVIPNGYDLDRFAPDPVGRVQLRQEWSLPDDVPLIGMVARFDPLKDHTNLIDALEKLLKKNVVFQAVLVGAGMDEDNEMVVAHLAQCGLTDRVRLLGSRRDIPAVMNALDIHVLSSSSEAFPNVLAEAMACGTPCVTTDVGDAGLIVGSTGWIVPPRAPVELSNALGQAIVEWGYRNGWYERQRMVRERITDNFSIERMVAHYRDVWVEAVNASKH